MMEQKINIAELLKDCPTGMELGCTMYDNVVLDTISDGSIYPIKIKTPEHFIFLTKNGCYSDNKFSKCVIFPKGKTTWEGFVPPCKFKDGDVLFVDCSDGEDKTYQYIFILNKIEFYGKWYSYCHLNGVGDFHLTTMYLTDDEFHPRFATEEEKAKLFDAIKANGYKWNAENKTLEKLSEPKFKVGDRIKHKTYISQGAVVTEIKDTHYILDDESALPFTFQDEYDLVPNKFDITTLVPFESRVLVRHNKDNKWCGSFFSHIDGDFHSHCYKYVTIAGKSYPMCIPYEKNEHLLGTTDDCDEYFKTW